MRVRVCVSERERESSEVHCHNQFPIPCMLVAQISFKFTAVELDHKHLATRGNQSELPSRMS